MHVVSGSLVLVLVPALVSSQSTLRASVDSSGLERQAASATAAVSGDGRFVAFASLGAFAPDDDEGVQDIWVHDRQTGLTERVSVSSAGVPADADCLGPSLSSDGRYVTFRTSATNLAPGDANGQSDVFVHDRQLGTTELVSATSGGQSGGGDSFYGSISDDGRFVAYMSDAEDLTAGDANLAYDVFVLDRQTGQTQIASVATDGTPTDVFQFSFDPSIAADGSAVAFASLSKKLAPGPVSGLGDVFVRDLAAQTTELVSAGLGGVPADGPSSVPTLSADGRFVVFASQATNLVPGDTNGVEDVFVHDRQTGQTELVSVAQDGGPANDRSYLYYVQPSLSADGRFVVFESYASNLAAPDTTPYKDVFVRDRLLGLTTLVTQSSAGKPTHQGGARATISADGSTVVFESPAGALVAGDANGTYDVFVRDLASACGPIEAYCDGKLSSQGCQPRIASAGQPSVSGAEAFAVVATGLTTGAPGTLIWGSGADAQPFVGGLLCVAAPFARTAPALAVDLPGAVPGCSGGQSFPFDAAWMAAQGIAAGTTVHAQWIVRDPGDAFGIGLSDALRFTACP